MLEDYLKWLDELRELIDLTGTPEYGVTSWIFTVLSIMILSILASEVVRKIGIRNRLLDMLIVAIASTWLFEQVFVRRIPLLSILISIVLLFAFLAIVLLVVVFVFVKKVPVPLPPKV